MSFQAVPEPIPVEATEVPCDAPPPPPPPDAGLAQYHPITLPVGLSSQLIFSFELMSFHTFIL